MSARRGYIVGPAYDWAFFLSTPVLSVVVGALLAGTHWRDVPAPFESDALRDGRAVTWSGLLLGTLVHGHLGAVFLRSHGNPSIARRYPLRVFVAPALLFAALLVSLWAVVLVTVLVVFWDVYHSGLQTFGLARMYDRNAGNDASAGRALDLVLSHVLYIGPIVAGATLLDHVAVLHSFADVEATFFTGVPPFLAAQHRGLVIAVLSVGVALVLAYVAGYVRLARRGHRISPQKAWLVASTGLCSIYAWGFNPWGQAFFIMNLFHAVQYLALVWAAEGRSLTARLRVASLRAGPAIAAITFLVTVLGYGFWAERVPADNRVLWSCTQVVAILHFWYDGFIWSVRRADA